MTIAIHDLTPLERDVVLSLRAVVAHRFGRIEIKVHEGEVEVLGAPKTRYNSDGTRKDIQQRPRCS